MSKTFGLLLCVGLSALLSGQTQTEFVIGAEWINKPNDISYELSSNDWDNILDLGLKWGHVVYTDQTLATNALNTAATNGLKLILERYEFPARGGKRWQYHPEYSGHYTSFSGRVGSVNNPSEDLDGQKYPDDPNDNNRSWKAIAPGTAGYIAKNLVDNWWQHDSEYYNVKVRMRITSGSWNGTHTPVVTLKVVKDAVEMTKIIYADDFGTEYDFTYKEMDPSLQFYKFPTGPTLSGSDPPPMPPPAQPKDQIQSIVTYTPYDYQVYWHGEVTCYIDYLIIDGGNSNDLFTGDHDDDINNEVNLFKSNSGLGKFKIMDEAYDYQWLPVGYVDQKIRSNVNASGYPSKTGSHYNFAWLYGDEKYTRREIAHTANTQNMMDYYPIDGNTPFPDAGNYTSELQSRIQNLAGVLRWNINQSNAYGTPFWYTPQIDYYDDLDNPGINLREPTTNEIKMMVNLSLTYGAKGIFYFLYWSCYFSNYNDQYYGLVNEDGSKRTIIYPGTSYSGNKWETLKSINQNLATIGPTLINLTWQNAFSIHQGQPTGTFITSVTTTDAANERYVELGLFKDAANTDYFMLVNRRTLSSEGRNITVSLNNSGFKEILEVASGKKFIIASNGTFTDTFAPGEGKLYKISPLTYSWSGNITVMNTVTVPSGTTLTVAPNTAVFFANGASLIVNGVLNATGTSSNKITFDRSGTTGNWGSIIFDGNASSNSILNNVEVKYASQVECKNNANVTIMNSLIDHCTHGIYIYNSAPLIRDNQILDPYGNGIYGEANGKAPLIQGNKIKKLTNNLYNYQGIYLGNYTNPFITENDIQGFYYGIYYGGGGTSWFSDADYNTPLINNRLAYNRVGLCTAWGSYTIAGWHNEGSHNSIYGNTYYDAKAYQYGQIEARFNWWGTDGPQISTYQGGLINAANVLDYDPWEGIPLPSGDPPMVVSDDIFTGILLEKAGRTDETIKHYKQMISRNYAPGFALARLATIKNKYSVNSIQNYLESLLTVNTDYKLIVLDLLAGIYLGDNNYNQAMQIYNKIIDEYPNSYGSVNAKFEKFFATLNYAKNITIASNILSEIQSLKLTEEEQLMRLEIADYLLNSFGSYGSQYLGKSSDSNQKNLQESLPKEYSLLENYPNPFNPTTKISYQLPTTAQVTLKVYDLLGREVATLVNEEKQPGYYEIAFDASNLSGGVYFYRIITKDFVKTMKMLLVK
jgi:tetratricopeptide (TPR) repeat protein